MTPSSKSKIMKTSLIVSTYNWKESLELVLESILHQTELPNEVIIADDGSREDTAQLIQSYQARFSVPLIHVWHEDKGFRASAIRNKAIKKSQYEYIIQIDGDVILHADFVKDHKRFAVKNHFISGSRVLLSPETTQKAIKLKKIKFGIFSKGIKNRFNAIRFPLFNAFFSFEKKSIVKVAYRIRGCNMSFWRKDLIEINGYDEDFVGWGREDSDLTIRLAKKGCSLRRIKLAALQYHLHHKENSRYNLEQNHRLMEVALKNDQYRAVNGIEK